MASKYFEQEDCIRLCLCEAIKCSIILAPLILIPGQHSDSDLTFFYGEKMVCCGKKRFQFPGICVLL